MGNEQRPARIAQVIGVKESLVLIEVDERTPVMKNEVGYILLGEERLKAEVLRIRGRTADMQVFEDTRGVRVGDVVELSGEMLSAMLGPGLLGQVYDGLLNPLHTLARKYGYFLPRGASIASLDPDKKWSFTPQASVGARLPPGGIIGTVPEGPFEHKIMVPFDEPDTVEITWIRSGSLPVNVVIARYRQASGVESEMTMNQRWPVRRPIPERLMRRGFAERLYPSEPLTTATRIIDTFFPIARGGTGCIPGPFGAGKTVLQSLIARYSSVDIAVIVACGERAGVMRCADGSTGSLTMIGTVSPAGGNFEEPVTQSALGTVKTFLGLSADRAYRRFYPAIGPLISWSRYLHQLSGWYRENLDPGWVENVRQMQGLLERGDSIYQIMQATGEEGVSLEDFIAWQKSVLVDMVYLQLDAFDEIDACMPGDRQLQSFGLLKRLIDQDYKFKDKKSPGFLHQVDRAL